MRRLTLEFLGATSTVTGSRTALSYQGRRYLVDCGLFQGTRDLRERNWQTLPGARDYKAVVLTHAHIDHSGYLPRLVKDGFRGPIFCSEATADLAKIMLLDAAHLQEEDARFANKTKHSRHEPALPLYTTQDAEMAISHLNPLPMEDWFELEPGLGFKFVRAGHILGSSLVQFQYSLGNGSRLLTFSGDLGNGRSHVIKPPSSISETDELILESTYGDRVQPQTDPLVELEAIVKKVVSRGGTLVIPAFTVGRTQELLFLLAELERQGRRPKVPVYVDSPMALDATDLYLRHRDELRLMDHGGELKLPISPSDFHAVQSTDESMLLCMNTEPKIVISAAGMLTGGRILHHLKAKLPDPKSGVMFVGYQADGTKGRLLRHGLTTVNIHHRPVTVEAEIFAIDSLSAHADSNDLMAWLRQLKRPPKKIFLNHGEPTALGALRYRIQYELGWQAEIAEFAKVYTLGGES